MADGELQPMYSAAARLSCVHQHRWDGRLGHEQIGHIRRSAGIKMVPADQHHAGICGQPHEWMLQPTQSFHQPGCSQSKLDLIHPPWTSASSLSVALRIGHKVMWLSEVLELDKEETPANRQGPHVEMIDWKCLTCVQSARKHLALGRVEEQAWKGGCERGCAAEDSPTLPRGVDERRGVERSAAVPPARPGASQPWPASQASPSHARP